jgi:ryanodine receptor 2
MKRLENNTQYAPQPFDTSTVVLPACLKEISEELAKNTHEIWAQQRFAEGWKYGAKRNDKRKEHPCLVPYEELPGNEKDYDLNTAMETIRFILSKGYNITRE